MDANLPNRFAIALFMLKSLGEADDDYQQVAPVVRSRLGYVYIHRSSVRCVCYQLECFDQYRLLPFTP